MNALHVAAVSALVVAICQVIQAMAGTPDPTDQHILGLFLERTAALPARITTEYCRQATADNNEMYAWLVFPQLNLPVTAYQLSGDAKYLDVFVTVFDNMRANLTEGPDGYLGWYGTPEPGYENPAKPGVKIDYIINSFRAVNAVGRFVEQVDKAPELRSKYAQAREAYLDLAENHLVKKWDVRGNYTDLGRLGAVYRGEYDQRPVSSELTMPHNKHSIITRGLLSLYRATGKDEYMRKAVKLGTRYKRSLTLKSGHYEWNYWDPSGEWDVNTAEKNRWKHWIGVEHRGGYFTLSLSQAVALYDYGLVFDRTDIDRFLKTQLEMCWNGELEDPKWARVDGTTSEQYMQGRYICEALAPFDAKIAEYCYGPRRQARLAERGGGRGGSWLLAKQLDLPAPQDGAPRWKSLRDRFLSNPENRALVDSLAFSVEEPGYVAPQTPADMEDMPRRP